MGSPARFESGLPPPGLLSNVESSEPEGVRAGLAELFDLAVRGQLKVTIGGTYPLERAADAHRALEERRTTGKLVLAA